MAVKSNLNCLAHTVQTSMISSQMESNKNNFMNLIPICVYLLPEEIAEQNIDVNTGKGRKRRLIISEPTKNLKSNNRMLDHKGTKKKLCSIQASKSLSMNNTEATKKSVVKCPECE